MDEVVEVGVDTEEKDDMNKVVKIDVEVNVEKLLEVEVDIVVIVDVKEVDRLNDVNEISISVIVLGIWFVE